MSKKRRKRRKNKRKYNRIGRENRNAMLVITVVVCVLFVVLAVQGYRLSRRIDANEAKRIELQRKIEKEENRTKEIEDLRTRIQSDEYIKDIAKEKLGLVEDGEIYFKAKTEN